MSARRKARAFFACAMCLASPGVASAEPTAPISPAAAQENDYFIDPKMRRTWLEGEPRPFMSAQIDAGYLYLRPRVAAGWGRPFHAWLGVEANPVAWQSNAGLYAGLRAAIPYLDFRVGARKTWAYQRRFLTPAETFDRYDLDATRNRHAQTLTLEAELESAIPVGPGWLLALASLSYVDLTAGGVWVFEETLRVVVAPPWVWRGRLGYAIPLPGLPFFSVAPVLDVLGVPERSEDVTIRAGFSLRAALSRHLELRGMFVPTIKSPDSLGLVGGDLTELGLRYRFATGAQ